jgi:uncharacterized membrane protein
MIRLGNKNVYRGFFGLFCGVAIVLAIWTGIGFQANGATVLLPALFGLVTIIVCVATGYVFLNYDKLSIVKIFSIFFIVFGVFYFSLSPAFSKNDEREHFLRILEITKGHFVSSHVPDSGRGGQQLPQNAYPIAFQQFPYGDTTFLNYKSLLANINTKMDEQDYVWYDFVNTAFYSPTNYIFQLPGALIATFVSVKPLIISYAERLSAFILSFCLLLLAIKKIPFKQKTFFLFATTPVFLFEATALAGDVLVNSISFAAIALAICYSKDIGSKIKNRQLLLIVILSILISLAKIVFFPFILVFLLIAFSKFENKKHWAIFFGSLIFVCLILNLTWLYFAQSTIARPSGQINSVIQAKHILTHPWDLVIVYIKGLFYNGYEMIMACFADQMGYPPIKGATVYVNKVIISIYLFLVLLVTASDKIENYKQTRKMQIMFLGLAILLVIMILGTLAKNFIPVEGVKLLHEGGATHSSGTLIMHGRIFIPSMFLIAMCLSIKKIKIDSNVLFRFVIPVISIAHLFVFSGIMLLFWR